MGHYSAIDTPTPVQIRLNYVETGAPASLDIDITFMRNRYYALGPDYTTVYVQRAPSTGYGQAALYTITLALPANTQARGITNDRHNLVCTLWDTLAVAADSLAWFNPITGALVRTVTISGGKVNALSNLVFFRKDYWCLGSTSSVLNVVSASGTLLRSVSITKLKRYVGITADRRSIWLTRSDVTEHTTGTVESWAIQNNTFIQTSKKAAPFAAGITVNNGITFNRRYKILQDLEPEVA